MSEITVISIVSGVLGIVAIVFAVRWAQTKQLLKEIAEAFKVLSDAIEDDHLTAEELKQIAKEFCDILKAIKAFGSK